MLTAILSAFAAIPELLKVERELLAYFKKAEEEKWFQKNNEAFDSLKKANTPEELLDAAKKIQSSLSSL